MDKATAELFAQVARRIGLKRVQIDDYNGGVVYWAENFNVNRARRFDDPTGWEEFDPITNPADLKKIIDVLMSGEIAQVRIDHVIGPDGVTWFVCEIHPYSKGPRIGPPAPCYVTALCKAIAALPEVEA